MEWVVCEFARLGLDRRTSFNTLAVLRVGADEVVHSGVLAWLLDATAGHGRGPLFLNLLMDALGLAVSLAPHDRYLVRREFSGPESVIDVCVCRPHDFLLYVENKIRAGEGTGQADRELRDMDWTGEANGVAATRRHAIFLTPDGRPPTSGDPSRWLCLSYPRLTDTLRAALPSLGDAKLAAFMADWLDTIAQWNEEP